jgi:hypothetical protein
MDANPIPNDTVSDKTKHKRRWYQYSLRTLLIFVTLVAIGMSWFAVKMQRARRQREAVELFEKRGHGILYDYQRKSYSAEPPGPEWLRKILGIDFFADVIAIQCFDKYDIQLPPATDKELKVLEDLNRLETLSLMNTYVTDAGLEHIKGLPHLTIIDLCHTKITDKGLEKLTGKTHLRILWLDRTQVTDAGLKHIENLTQLEQLSLNDTQITDAGLEHLKGLRKLSWLFLINTKVTVDGIRKLEKLLPNTEITTEEFDGENPEGNPFE